MKPRELNPELFGSSLGAVPAATPALNSLDLGLPIEPLDFDEQVQSTKKNIDFLQSQLEEVKLQQQELGQSSKLKIDRLQVGLSRLEQTHNAFVQELGEKLHQVMIKLTDQKKNDHKVQDLIDRHSNLLKGYEVRMNQLQKVLAQKEAEVVEMNSLLNEAKMEIARLKRLF